MMDKLCVNPWLSLHVDGLDGYNPCCLYKKSYAMDLDSYISGPLQEIKKSFLSGKPPEECIACFDEETRGMTSRRMRDNKRYGRLFKKFNESSPPDRFVTYYIRMGNHCNLRCMTCNSSASSGWVSENKKYGNTDGSVWALGSDSEVWQKIRQNAKSVGLINFIGGEPFMMLEDQQLSLLDDLIASGDSKHITLQYNTNCTRRYMPIAERWKHFNKIEIKVSMDGVGKRFEYLRYPANYEDFLKNLDWYSELARTTDHIDLMIIYTVSIFNIGYTDEIITFCKERGLDIFYNALLHPGYFHPACVPIVREWITSRLSTIEDEEFQSYIGYFNQLRGMDLTDQFKQMVAMIDNRRTLKFQDVFPELARNI